MTKTTEDVSFEGELEDLISTWEVDTFAGVDKAELVKVFMRIVKSFEYQKVAGIAPDTSRAVQKLVSSMERDGDA